MAGMEGEPPGRDILKKQLLRVEAPHFVAAAMWVKTGEGWRCDPKQTAPIIRWMIGKTASYVGDYLRRKGWKYEWLVYEEDDECNV